MNMSRKPCALKDPLENPHFCHPQTPTSQNESLGNSLRVSKLGYLCEFILMWRHGRSSDPSLDMGTLGAHFLNLITIDAHHVGLPCASNDG